MEKKNKICDEICTCGFQEGKECICEENTCGCSEKCDCDETCNCECHDNEATKCICND